jgi:hypothetical protein
MARPNKEGLDYFPFDTNLFQDIRIRKLIKYQSGKAVTVYALLLCIIYKDGYYMRWDKELPFIISEQTGFEEAYVLEVINSCLKLGLFSNELYTSDGILTSRGIQERYKKICDLCRRKSEISEFSLISSEEIGISSEEKPINSAKSTQRKGNKNKESLNTRETLFENFKNELLGDEEWRRYACQISGLSVAFNDLIPDELDNFLAWMVSTGEGDTLKTIDDVKRRFTYWWQGTGLRAYNQRHNGGTRKETFGGYTSHAGAYGKREAPAKTGVQPSEEARKDYTERF